MLNYEEVERTSPFTIFVGGLSKNVTNEDLYEYFHPFGNLICANVRTWRNNPKKCKGFAIIVAEDSKTYQNILEATHNIKGRIVECKKMIFDTDLLEQHNQESNQRKIFVCGLSKKTTNEDLINYFSNFGPVSIAYIVNHYNGQKSRGFGFVCFSDPQDKNKVFSNGQLFLNGKPIQCLDYMKRPSPKEEKLFSQNSEFTTLSSGETTPRRVLEDLLNLYSSYSASKSAMLANLYSRPTQTESNLRFNLTTVIRAS
jgi:RNA recognition motif-containing protein